MKVTKLAEAYRFQARICQARDPAVIWPLVAAQLARELEGDSVPPAVEGGEEFRRLEENEESRLPMTWAQIARSVRCKLRKRDVMIPPQWAMEASLLEAWEEAYGG